MHAASDQTADVHCLELRTGDFVQFVPPNANAAALDFAKVSTPSLEFRIPQVVPCLRVSLRALPGVIRSGARVLLSSCVAQVYSDLDALQRAVRVNVTYKLLPSLSSNSKNNSPQQAQSCHLQVALLSACFPRASSLPPLRIIAIRKISGQV